MKGPTALEQQVLDVVLVELRRAMRGKEQLTIILDPYIVRGATGLSIFASPNARGRSYEIDGIRRQARRRTR